MRVDDLEMEEEGENGWRTVNGVVWRARGQKAIGELPFIPTLPLWSLSSITGSRTVEGEDGAQEKWKIRHSFDRHQKEKGQKKQTEEWPCMCMHTTNRHIFFLCFVCDQLLREGSADRKTFCTWVPLEGRTRRQNIKMESRINIIEENESGLEDGSFGNAAVRDTRRKL